MTIGKGTRELSNQGTVLALASNALEIKFDFEGEIQKIHAAAIAGSRFRMSAHWSCPPETIRRLVADEKPEVIHILAPTVDKDNRLVLSDQNGMALPVSLESVVDMMSRPDMIPKLIVINTCHSLRLAEALADHAGATIAMNGLINDTWAVAFAERLYERLALGATLAAAFESAREAVDISQRHFPVLVEGQARPTDITIGSTSSVAASSAGPATVKAFCSYAHEDVKHLESLHKFLAPLRRSGILDMWHDRQLLPGQNWSREIDRNVDLASLMVLLVSASFLNSDYCVGIELQRALDRNKSGGLTVVPVIVSPCPWDADPVLQQLQSLPSRAKPVTTWSNRDSAWTDVVQQLHETIKTIGRSGQSAQA